MCAVNLRMARALRLEYPGALYHVTTAVEKWEHRAPDLDADEFVESISFRETRDYVKRVVANYRTYRRLYAPAN